jgi:hypothetical protein
MSPKLAPTSFMMFYVPVRPFRQASCSAKCQYLEHFEVSQKDSNSIQYLQRWYLPCCKIAVQYIVE